MSRIVTIDGPASAGKTTVGFELARRLGYQFIDSGSIYRAGCYHMLCCGHSLENDAEAALVFNSLDIRFNTTEHGQQVYLFDKDVSPYLALPEVTAIVPVVGGRKLVREVVKNKQRALGMSKDTVMTGRDIGTEIFPDASTKYFLTAAPEVRAYRRFVQLKLEGYTADLVDLLEKIIQRDTQDATRTVSPFRMPEGAIVIDTSQMGVGEVVEKMYYHALGTANVEGKFSPPSKERF